MLLCPNGSYTSFKQIGKTGNTHQELTVLICIYIVLLVHNYFFWMENIKRHRITIMWHWTVSADVFSKPYWQVNRKRAYVTVSFPSPNTVSWPQRRRFNDVNQQGFWKSNFDPFWILIWKSIKVKKSNTFFFYWLIYHTLPL